MKILFKLGGFPKISETFIVNHLFITLEMGFDVEILVDELGDLNKTILKDSVYNQKIKENIQVLNYGIPKLGVSKIFKVGILLALNLFSLRSIWQYYSIKRNFKLAYLFEWVFYKQYRDVDLIHIQYGTNHKPIDDLKASGFFQMPVVVTFHGHDAFFPINGVIPKNNYYTKLFKQAKIVTVNTPYLKEQLLRIGCPAQKLRILPVPVNTSFFYTKTSEKPFFSQVNLLSVGRLERIKGFDLGLKIVSNLIKRGWNVRYTIIGEGSIRKDIDDLIEQLDLKNKVVLLGARSPEEIRQYYWKSHLFLMTSRPENGIRETQGLVSLEAQASGLPVVAFASGGVEYTILNGKTGFLCEENNVVDFTLKVEEILRDHNVLEELKTNCFPFVEKNFSNSVMAKKWAQIYNGLIND